MRIATISGRAALLVEGGSIDIEQASAGQFPSDVMGVYDRWAEFAEWARDARFGSTIAPRPLDRRELGAPSPNPRQVFAIGLNYHAHVAEAGLQRFDDVGFPATFTKFQTSLTGPDSELQLPSDKVDWEVELVVVIGARADAVAADDAWSYVAGLTAGQDYSERDIQRAGPVPQFSMGKSFAGFGPTGPWLVTVDEFANPNDLELECAINGETVQRARTSELILPVSELVARLSAVCVLLPGDIIFTGTPSGVGMGRSPERYLADGDEVVSTVEGIGTLRQICRLSKDRQTSLRRADLAPHH